MPRMQAWFADRKDAKESVAERKKKGLEFGIAKVMETYKDGSDKLEAPAYYVGPLKHIEKLEKKPNMKVTRLKTL